MSQSMVSTYIVLCSVLPNVLVTLGLVREQPQTQARLKVMACPLTRAEFCPALQQQLY